MCGISGFYDANGTPELLRAMLRTLKHRGPDNHGIYFNSPLGLAHNRLAVIDLSERSNQPMHYDDVTIVLNGEIYNYREIREKLELKGYRFTTLSDTEVVAAAYLEWGDYCVHYFVGMWALAIWDPKKNLLFCSRDRFGIKPFYYIHSGNRFYFGSEYKPLKKSPLFHPTINEQQIARGLKLGWTFFRDETYFSCIKRLPAAHNLYFDGQSISLKRYWDIQTGYKISLSKEERMEKFRELFMDSIRLHMRSDVRVGSCLSGGIDSSSIVSAVSTLFPEKQLDTFTVYYDGNNEVDERPWVEEVLKKYPNLVPHFYKPADDELAEAFEEANYYADVPIAGSSMLSQYFVMKLASEKGVKVLLDGQGSDEYLAGYLHSFDRLVGDMLRKHQYLEAVKTLRHIRSTHHHSIRQSVMNAFKSVISRFNNENDYYRYAYKYQYPTLTRTKEDKQPFQLEVLRETSRFDEFLVNLVFTTSLPTLLHFEDRNSMAFGIESRVPFLDHRLVEFSFSLGDEDKINYGQTKYILRHALQGILPEAIVRRQDKKGFVTPGEDKWLRGPLRQLLNIDFRDYDFIDNRKVQDIIRNYKAGGSNGILVWRLVALHYWLGTV